MCYLLKIINFCLADSLHFVFVLNCINFQILHLLSPNFYIWFILLFIYYSVYIDFEILIFPPFVKISRNRNLLRWQQPRLSNGTLYLHKGKWWHLHLKCEETLEKFLPAARAMLATENPSDIGIISSRSTDRRDTLKSVADTQATSIAGHFSSGDFTGQIQAVFQEPPLLVVTDPRTDCLPLPEAS